MTKLNNSINQEDVNFNLPFDRETIKATIRGIDSLLLFAFTNKEFPGIGNDELRDISLVQTLKIELTNILENDSKE